jgi:hypothetical protein
MLSRSDWQGFPDKFSPVRFGRINHGRRRKRPEIFFITVRVHVVLSPSEPGRASFLLLICSFPLSSFCRIKRGEDTRNLSCCWFERGREESVGADKRAAALDTEQNIKEHGKNSH